MVEMFVFSLFWWGVGAMVTLSMISFSCRITGGPPPTRSQELLVWALWPVKMGTFLSSIFVATRGTYDLLLQSSIQPKPAEPEKEVSGG